MLPWLATLTDVYEPARSQVTVGWRHDQQRNDCEPATWANHKRKGLIDHMSTLLTRQPTACIDDA